MMVNFDIEIRGTLKGQLTVDLGISNHPDITLQSSTAQSQPLVYLKLLPSSFSSTSCNLFLLNFLFRAETCQGIFM